MGTASLFDYANKTGLDLKKYGGLHLARTRRFVYIVGSGIEGWADRKSVV